MWHQQTTRLREICVHTFYTVRSVAFSICILCILIRRTRCLYIVNVNNAFTEQPVHVHVPQRFGFRFMELMLFK